MSQNTIHALFSFILHLLSLTSLSNLMDCLLQIRECNFTKVNGTHILPACVLVTSSLIHCICSINVCLINKWINKWVLAWETMSDLIYYFSVIFLNLSVGFLIYFISCLNPFRFVMKFKKLVIRGTRQRLDIQVILFGLHNSLLITTENNTVQ